MTTFWHAGLRTARYGLSPISCFHPNNRSAVPGVFLSRRASPVVTVDRHAAAVVISTAVVVSAAARVT